MLEMIKQEKCIGCHTYALRLNNFYMNSTLILNIDLFNKQYANACFKNVQFTNTSQH